VIVTLEIALYVYDILFDEFPNYMLNVLSVVMSLQPMFVLSLLSKFISKPPVTVPPVLRSLSSKYIVLRNTSLVLGALGWITSDVAFIGRFQFTLLADFITTSLE